MNDVIQEYGIPYCTFWALSPENFKKRSSFEIKNLLWILEHFIKTRVSELNEKNIKMNIIGNTKELPSSLQKQIEKAQQETIQNTGLTLTFAINYGGRDEMIRAIEKLRLNSSSTEMTQEMLTQALDTSGLPDPDLIIRTGGEKRTSGFMLWQSEYAEYSFVDTLFPDFSPKSLRACIEEFNHRNRRFGS